MLVSEPSGGDNVGGSNSNTTNSSYSNSSATTSSSSNLGGGNSTNSGTGRFIGSVISGKGLLGGSRGPPLGHHGPVDVEARLANTPPLALIRSISSLSQHSLRPKTPETEQEDGLVAASPTLRKGMLLQARDRLFSRWKERYFVLTRDYLACFRKGTTKYSEMGCFIFKVNLASVENVEWQDRRGGPVLSLSLPREGRVLLRAKLGLDQWYRLLLEATSSSRQRRIALRRGTSTTQLNHLTNNNVDVLQPVKSSGSLQFSLSDSTPEISQLCEDVCHNTSPGNSRRLTRPNRFSLLAEVEVGSCDTDIATPPSSVTSSHKFSSSTSNTSGSGGSSSLTSSPSLRGSGGWPRPPSPVRPSLGVVGGPRTRLSLYDGPRESLQVGAKMRHSVCVEPKDLHADVSSCRRYTGPSNRHSVCVESKNLASSRASLCLEPRNPLLDLLELGSGISRNPPHHLSPNTSPSKSIPDTKKKSDLIQHTGHDDVEMSPSPQLYQRPRAHSASMTPERAMAPRSRTNLALFRNSGLFN